jgi:hypothetical protein
MPVTIFFGSPLSKNLSADYFYINEKQQAQIAFTENIALLLSKPV